MSNSKLIVLLIAGLPYAHYAFAAQPGRTIDPCYPMGEYAELLPKAKLQHSISASERSPAYLGASYKWHALNHIEWTSTSCSEDCGDAGEGFGRDYQHGGVNGGDIYGVGFGGPGPFGWRPHDIIAWFQTVRVRSDVDVYGMQGCVGLDVHRGAGHIDLYRPIPVLGDPGQFTCGECGEVNEYGESWATVNTYAAYSISPTEDPEDESIVSLQFFADPHDFSYGVIDDPCFPHRYPSIDKINLKKQIYARFIVKMFDDEQIPNVITYTRNGTITLNANGAVVYRGAFASSGATASTICTMEGSFDPKRKFDIVIPPDVVRVEVYSLLDSPFALGDLNRTDVEMDDLLDYDPVTEDYLVSWADRVVMSSLLGLTIDDDNYDMRADLNNDGVIDLDDLILFNGIPCTFDFDEDGEYTVLDTLDFYAAFANNDPAADVNGDGVHDVLDTLDFFDIVSQYGCEPTPGV